MKIAIVHISDMHLKGVSDVGFKRREKLLNTISYSRSAEEELLILVTGDIANTGSANEYKVASTFFRELLTGLNLEIGTPSSPIILIPGNHDCDFHGIGDLRQILLDQIHDQLENVEVGGETVKAILQVQNNFFEFNAEITGIEVPTNEQLFFRRRLEFGAHKLELRCFNSAWLSSLDESVGSLDFPSSVVEAAADRTDCDVVISLLHHPFNWIGPATYQRFRKAVQQGSDFLLTGHEHSAGGQIIEPFAGARLVHCESGPFQPSMSGESEFCIIHLDLDARNWRREAFAWQNGSYAKIMDGEPQVLDDLSLRSSALTVIPSFWTRLNDPGTGFLHPRQQRLTLNDIFVYPDLKTRWITNRLRFVDELPKEIQSAEVLEKVLSTERLVIAGPTDSGKTALSKMLFMDGNTRRGRTCLLLCGANIRGNDPAAAFKKAVERALSDAYGPDQHGRYAGLDRKQRVLIIDDWDEVGLNRAGRDAILKQATAQFGCIVLFADDIFLIEEISGRHEYMPLSEFQIADIREFGFRLRGELVRRWHSLGNMFVEDEKALARKIFDSSRVIDTVLGRNPFPSYPVNVLTLLQTYDANAGSGGGGLGSYGQVYEALITARLARVSIKSIDIGTKMTLLSRVAWYLFNRGQGSIGDSEWREIIAIYFDEYAIALDGGVLLASLIDAGIIRADESRYRFTYGYALCYFVAKYFQENLADLGSQGDGRDLYEKLKSLSERIYKQDNANIVIFYVFLTKDRELIQHLMANARKIFAEFEEFDFDGQVEFVNKIIKPATPALLPEKSAALNQQAYDKRRDESGEQIEPRGDPKIEIAVYGPALPYEQKLIIGIRYLMLMGQVLRNFPGSLKKEVKLELALESYSLGLRILGSVFQLSQRNSGAMTKDIAEILRRKMAFSGPESELQTQAELIVADLLREVTFGILKRLSHAIGLSELEETYEEVARLRNDNLACQMIQLSIRLDHFSRFPKEAISKLAKELQKNTFSYQTLRDLVLNYLYLFPADFSIQQWSGQLLNFKANVPQILGSSRKMMGS